MGQILEPVLAEFPERYPVRQGVRGQSASGLGKQNLAAVSGITNASGPVDIHADIAGLSAEWLTGVQTHAYSYRDAVRPLVADDGLLRRHSCRQGVFGTREGDEDGISLGINLVSVSLLASGAQELTIFREDLCVAVAQLLEKARGPLDVGEEEGNSP